MDSSTRLAYASYVHPQSVSGGSLPTHMQLQPVRPQILHFMDPQQPPPVKPVSSTLQDPGLSSRQEKVVQRSSSQPGSLRRPSAGTLLQPKSVGQEAKVS